MSDAVTIPTPTLDKDGAKNEVEQAFSTKTSNIDKDNSLTNEKNRSERISENSKR
ncbi:TPA: hypothetical protein VUQ51_001603 [Streptococcus pneumoniae]|nr:hypothetical protein [Streptococcus pneumoniae]HEU1778923.1 hypothetical protein [Streptococcus pneumoniae]